MHRAATNQETANRLPADPLMADRAAAYQAAAKRLAANRPAANRPAVNRVAPRPVAPNPVGANYVAPNRVVPSRAATNRVVRPPARDPLPGVMIGALVGAIIMAALALGLTLQSTASAQRAAPQSKVTLPATPAPVRRASMVAPSEPTAAAAAATPEAPAQQQTLAAAQPSSPPAAATMAAATEEPQARPAEARNIRAVPESTAAPAVAAVPSPPPVPALMVKHTVSAGETITTIAKRYGLKPETLAQNNAGLAGRDHLAIGQTLRIPARDGLLYEVQSGETVASISRRFGVEPSVVVNEPANQLAAPDQLRAGQTVLVPGAQVAQVPATPVPVPLPQATPRPMPTIQPMPSVLPVPTLVPRATPLPTLAPLPVNVGPVAGNSQTTLRAGSAAPVATPRPPGGGFIWPIAGPISSYFGPAHPLGIDVDLYGRQGAPIGAARGGTVTYAGGNPCCSYGYYVEIDHGDGFTTLYGHLNAPPPVRSGQVVSQGALIGYAGNTGNSTGTHLHFEVRRNGVPLNPLFYLP